MNHHMLVLKTGDDALASITKFAKRNNIAGASFSAIGAFREATVAWWNWDTKEYEHIEIAEPVEVLTLTGNVSRSGDEVKLHAHVTLGRRDGAAAGGHLVRAIVRPTLEVVLIDHGTRLTRHKDSATGLWLLS
jgi:uncharacterized protein